MILTILFVIKEIMLIMVIVVKGSEHRGLRAFGNYLGSETESGSHLGCVWSCGIYLDA